MLFFMTTQEVTNVPDTPKRLEMASVYYPAFERSVILIVRLRIDKFECSASNVDCSATGMLQASVGERKMDAWLAEIALDSLFATHNLSIEFADVVGIYHIMVERMRTDDVSAVAQSANGVPAHRSFARSHNYFFSKMPDIFLVALNEIRVDKQRGIDAELFQNGANHIGAIRKAVVERKRHQRAVGMLPCCNHPRGIFEAYKLDLRRQALQLSAKSFGMSRMSLTASYHVPVEYVHTRRRLRHRTENIQHTSASYIS